jgi:hypothetical protein
VAGGSAISRPVCACAYPTGQVSSSDSSRTSSSAAVSLTSSGRSGSFMASLPRIGRGFVVERLSSPSSPTTGPPGKENGVEPYSSSGLPGLSAGLLRTASRICCNNSMTLPTASIEKDCSDCVTNPHANLCRINDTLRRFSADSLSGETRVFGFRI